MIDLDYQDHTDYTKDLLEDLPDDLPDNLPDDLPYPCTGDQVDILPIDMKKSTVIIELEDNVVGIHTIYPNIDSKCRTVHSRGYKLTNSDLEIQRKMQWSLGGVINIDDDKYNTTDTSTSLPVSSGRIGKYSIDQDEPDVDEPNVDEPNVDEPNVDEPDVDEPNVDEPDVDDTCITSLTGKPSGDNGVVSNDRLLNTSVQQPKKNRSFIMPSDIVELEELLHDSPN